MTVFVKGAVIFYYIAFARKDCIMNTRCYISEEYLFVVALNVGFLKRFSGL
jgi:hypothetical protein